LKQGFGLVIPATLHRRHTFLRRADERGEVAVYDRAP
jgi:hypothetical protein